MEEADQAVDLMEEVKDSDNEDKTEGKKETETKLNEEEPSGEGAKMMVDEPSPDKNLSERVTMEEEESNDNVATTSLTIPTKSRSLRTTSVRKRLEIEVRMKHHLQHDQSHRLKSNHQHLILPSHHNDLCDQGEDGAAEDEGEDVEEGKIVQVQEEECQRQGEGEDEEAERCL